MNTITLNGKSRIVAGVAAIAMAGALALAFSAPAHAATAQLKGSATTATKYSKAVKMGKTVGSAKATGKTIKGIKITMSGVKGNVVYKVYKGSSAKTAKNGKAAKSKGAQAISVSLSGTAKKKYDVYYRVYVPKYGWMGWAKNGAKAGTKVSGKNISAYQVKLVAKGKKFASYTTTSAAAYTTNANFFKLTGDAAADAQIVTMTKSTTLENAFKKFVLKMSYAPTGRAGLAKGSYPTARLAVEGKAAFTAYKGDCYTYTAGVYYMATMLGYKATPISGEMCSALGDWKSNSWCEVVNSGIVQIWNGNLQDQADGNFTGKMTLNKLAVNEDDELVVTADDKFSYAEDVDGKKLPATVTPKLYAFTYDQVINQYAMFASNYTANFTGYGYRK